MLPPLLELWPQKGKQAGVLAPPKLEMAVSTRLEMKPGFTRKTSPEGQWRLWASPEEADSPAHLEEAGSFLHSEGEGAR